MTKEKLIYLVLHDKISRSIFGDVASVGAQHISIKYIQLKEESKCRIQLFPPS